MRSLGNAEKQDKKMDRLIKKCYKTVKYEQNMNRM